MVGGPPQAVSGGGPLCALQTWVSYCICLSVCPSVCLGCACFSAEGLGHRFAAAWVRMRAAFGDG